MAHDDQGNSRLLPSEFPEIDFPETSISRAISYRCAVQPNLQPACSNVPDNQKSKMSPTEQDSNIVTKVHPAPATVHFNAESPVKKCRKKCENSDKKFCGVEGCACKAEKPDSVSMASTSTTNPTCSLLCTRQLSPHIAHKATKKLSTAHCRRQGVFNALLRHGFYHYGVALGNRPWIALFVMGCVGLLTGGLVNMRLEDRVRDGFTPIGSPSFHEYEIYKDFMGTTGDPMFTVAIVRAKDGGSVVRENHLQAATGFAKYIISNYTVVQDGIRPYKFTDLCHRFCNLNQMVDLYLASLRSQKLRLAQNRSMDRSIKLDYPWSLIHGVNVSLFQTLRQVERYNKSEAKNLPSMIKNAGLLLLIFRADKTVDTFTEDGEDLCALWELGAYEFVRDNFNDPYIRVDLVGSEVLNSEIIKGGRATVPFFALGFVIMSVFVVMAALGSALYYDQMDAGKFILAFGAILSPALAVGSTLGCVSLLGSRINSMTLVVPFLVMAIGVDDAFLMVHSWQRTADKMNKMGLAGMLSIKERLGVVLEDTGPSITITSLTNCLAFGSGTAPRTAALAMAMDYAFEVTFFAAVLAVSAKFEKKKLNLKVTSLLGGKKNGEICEKSVPPDVAEENREAPLEIRKKLHSICQALLRAYCKFLMQKVTVFCILVACAIYWVFILWGAMKIVPRLDGQKLLPSDSMLKEVDKVITNVVWNEYHPVSFIVDRPMNTTNKTDLNLFYTMVNQLETMENAIGQSSTMLWLNEYKRFYEQVESMNWFDFGYADYDSEKLEDGTFSLDYLPEFLDDFRFRYYEGDVRWHMEKGKVHLDRFIFKTIYHNTSSWSTKTHLMQQWRAIAKNYSTFNVSVFEASSHFIDQILSLKYVTVTSVLYTFVCMAVVCAIFIPSPCSVVCASWAIAAISLGTFGMLSWMGMDLDPVVMSATLMTVGVSVDFTAHVSYHYQHTGKAHDDSPMCSGKLERLERTLTSIAWPMLQAGMSTIFCVCPLALLKSYAPTVRGFWGLKCFEGYLVLENGWFGFERVFLYSIILVVIWGLLHGLLVLPAFLAALPNCMTGAECCGKEHNEQLQSDGDVIEGLSMLPPKQRRLSKDASSGCHGNFTDDNAVMSLNT